jgi:predicted ATPase/DNA-binding XRE family transcriptional regulator
VEEKTSFGVWLRKQRRALDLSRQAFADEVGCAEVTLRRIEAGTLKPSKELASLLVEKLGIPEAERTQWISFARGGPGPALPLSLSPSSKPITNLPAGLTSFIGRQKELSEIIRLITKHRLVTLTGSGGIGKTRLSIKVGEQIAGDYLDGVWLVELAPILDPSLVPHTTALSIGLREDPKLRIIDSLCDYLHEKRMLLLFDNCEHVLDAAAQLIDTLLKTCHQLKILTTSREPLNMTGEAIYRVPSLGLPNLQQILDTFRDNESLQLFEERAQLVRFDFSLTLENVVSVAQICQRLDGIPLAIELAAAKVAVFSTEQIANQLNDSFNLLTGGSRTALPRHRTLRAAIDWSYNLLTSTEQVLFERLSVFVDGWTLEAAESVCNGGSVKREDVLNLLEQLINKSLVIIEEAGHEARYRMLETIRQYAHEKLAESGESEAVRGRHLDFFLAVALRFEQEVHSSQSSNWMQRVNSEHGNLREAMNWAGDSGQAPSGLRLGFALHYYWLTYGYWSLGRESLERLLARPEAAEHTKVRADALNLAGDLATQQGDLKAAWTLLKESKAIGMEMGESGKPSLGWACMLLGQSLMGHDRVMAQQELDQSIVLLREAGESWRFAIALLVRGNLAESQGDLVQARKLFNESLTVLRNIGDTMTSALATQALGRIFYYQGEYAAASAHLRQALQIHRTWEKDIFIPEVLGSLGSIALFKGNHEQAATHFDERLAMVRALTNKASIAIALCDLGISLGHLGIYARATSLLKEGLELSQEIGDPYLIAACVTGLAGIQQQPRRAAQMLAAAQAAFEQSGEFINPLYRVVHERTENRIHEALDAQDFARFSAEGQAMTVEQAIALALETVEEM